MDFHACRICLTRKEQAECVELNDSLKEKLKECVREMDLEVSGCRTLCRCCHSELLGAHTFRSKCLSGQRKLDSFIRSLEGDAGAVDLERDLEKINDVDCKRNNRSEPEHCDNNFKLKRGKVDEVGSDAGCDLKHEVEDERNYCTVKVTDCSSLGNDGDSSTLAVKSETIENTSKVSPDQKTNYTEDNVNFKNVKQDFITLVPIQTNIEAKIKNVICDSDNVNDINVADDSTYENITTNDKNGASVIITVNKNVESNNCVEVDNSNSLLVYIDVDNNDKKGIKEENMSCSPEGICNDVEFVSSESNVSTPAKECTFLCSSCGMCFKTKSKLSVHMRNHSNTLRHKCDICEKRYRHASSLKIHRRTHAKDITDERLLAEIFICDTCNKHFYDKNYLRKHMKKHGKHKYPCDSCDRTFYNKGDLGKHRRIHTGEKPYECKMCEMKFRVSASLTRHTRAHTGEKPYICETCGKCFNQKYNLTSHMAMHSNVKQYKCDSCSMRFRHKATRDTHVMRLHAKGKKLKCETCFLYFSNEENLTAHKCRNSTSTSGD